MAYWAGEVPNWHFDRSEFTTTLLLQSLQAGGEFQYRCDLVPDQDPNYAGAARLLTGRDDWTLRSNRSERLQGQYTASRDTGRGAHDRIIAVFSYYEKPDVRFSRDERLGFVGAPAARVVR